MTWQEEFNKRRCAERWYGCVVGDGWKDLVLKTDEMLAFIDPNYKINQVKQKFGTLRYYYESELEEDNIDGIKRKIMDYIVSEAERRSASICEQCGKPGELDARFYYVLTLCEECQEKRLAKGKAE